MPVIRWDAAHTDQSLVRMYTERLTFRCDEDLDMRLLGFLDASLSCLCLGTRMNITGEAVEVSIPLYWQGWRPC